MEPIPKPKNQEVEAVSWVGAVRAQALNRFGEVYHAFQESLLSGDWDLGFSAEKKTGGGGEGPMISLRTNSGLTEVERTFRAR